MVVSKDFLAQYGAQSSEARVGTSSTTGHSQHGPMNPSTGPPTNMQRTSSLLAESMNDPISVPHSNNLSSFFNELEMELGLDQDSIPAERENTRVPKRSAVDCLMHSWIQERIAPDFLPFNENAWVCVHELVEKRVCLWLCSIINLFRQRNCWRRVHCSLALLTNHHQHIPSILE